MNIGIAVAEYSKRISESFQSPYQETSVVTGNFNHPGKDYENYISPDLSTQMSDGQNW